MELPLALALGIPISSWTSNNIKYFCQVCWSKEEILTSESHWEWSLSFSLCRWSDDADVAAQVRLQRWQCSFASERASARWCLLPAHNLWWYVKPAALTNVRPQPGWHLKPELIQGMYKDLASHDSTPIKILIYTGLPVGESGLYSIILIGETRTPSIFNWVKVEFCKRLNISDLLDTKSTNTNV